MKEYIWIGVCILLIAAVVILWVRYRMLERERNCGIFHQIKEQTRLAQELERMRIEKETLEKIVKRRLSETDNQHISPFEAGHTDCKSARAGAVNKIST